MALDSWFLLSLTNRVILTKHSSSKPHPGTLVSEVNSKVLTIVPSLRGFHLYIHSPHHPFSITTIITTTTTTIRQATAEMQLRAEWCIFEPR